MNMKQSKESVKYECETEKRYCFSMNMKQSKESVKYEYETE